MRSARMQEHQTSANDRIARRSQPANFLFRQAREITTQRVDKERLRHLCQHGFAACSTGSRFLNQMQQQILEPLTGGVRAQVNFESGRQTSENRAAQERIANHKPANETSYVTTSASLHRAQIVRSKFCFHGV